MKKHRFDKNFWIISFALFFFMISFNIILPELNDFISDLGGKDQKGLVITLFTITAALSRPFSGKLSDTIGRKKVMMIGMGIAAVTSLLYPITGLFSFLFLRLMHGLSAGFLPTGATALVTDILRSDQRGVGMGIWGTFSSVGIGFGQIFASYITEYFGLTGLFFTASFFAILTGILLLSIKETLPEVQPFRWNHLQITMKDVFDPSVTPAAIVMFCQAISSGIVFVITPDISGFLGISNKGWFFGFYMLSTIFIRLMASGLSDKIGRRKTLILGLSFMVIAMLMLGFSRDWGMYTAGSIVFGIATGISSPTLFAWTADLSAIERRGVGAGTLFIALELGIMIGSVSTLLTYDNQLRTIPVVFIFGAIFSLLAIGYLIWHLLKKSDLSGHSISSSTAR
ncbi:MAG: MFS transporter [Bacteroidetes bacterium]|nr:MAG: MFS transporter [Bacteroidota bacterium]